MISGNTGNSNIVVRRFTPDGGFQRFDKDGNLVSAVKAPPTDLSSVENFYKTSAAVDAIKNRYYPGSGVGLPKSSSDGTGASSNLFGNLGEVGGMFDQFADKSVGRAKDWAQFQLGLNAQQGEQDFGFRNREATRDFGFQTSLAGQQIEGNKSLEGLRQNSETDRLQRSLTSQQTMQQADFGNQSQQRAQQAALARLGFAGRR